MQHDEKKGHGGARGIEPHQLFGDNDMGRTGNGQKFCGSLDQAQQKDLKECRFHGIKSWGMVLGDSIGSWR
jgi:hypothetical protein